MKDHELTQAGRREAVVEEIYQERKRQVESEGWSSEHDDQNDDGEMAEASACYASVAGLPDSRYEFEKSQNNIPGLWPWGRIWWKPTNKRRDLIKAAALIVAEIERIDRKCDV